MRESFFNIYHLLAGSFVPYWLLSRREVSREAKLAYSKITDTRGNFFIGHSFIAIAP
jgi:hypothetical protein